MRSNLLLKIFVRLFLGFLFCVLLTLISNSIGVVENKGLLSLFIFFVYSIFVVNKYILKPLHNLVNVVLPIDFRLQEIDLTQIDNLYFNDNCEISLLGIKFKELSDIIVQRVDRINEETYISEHDSLSGLYNRVRFEKYKKLYNCCDCICVVYIDVNNLKKMNDNFGHDAGDSLIRKASESISKLDLSGDFYRMGGDEFMVIITDTPKKICNRHIENWYSSVGSLNRLDDGFKCELSYGVAFSSGDFDIDKLITEADEKMYKHKISIKIRNGEDPNSR